MLMRMAEFSFAILPRQYDIIMLILKNDQGNILCGNLVCSTLEWGYLPPKTEVLDGWLFYSESFGEWNKSSCFI